MFAFLTRRRPSQPRRRAHARPVLESLETRNCLSAPQITSFMAMPLFVRWFGWWLFPADTSTWRATSKGIAILVVLFALEVAALWQLLPW